VRTEILARDLHDHRRSLLAWAIGIALYAALIVVVWPSIRDSAQLTKAFRDYPDALKQLFGGEAGFDFGTSAGYLNAELFSLMYPLMLAVFAIAFGASTLAGEEERGVLDLVLAYPVRRGRVVTEKAVALLVGLAGLAVVSTLTMLLVGLAVSLGQGTSALVAAVTGSALVAAATGTFALFVGAWRGSRSAAIGAAAAVFVGGYLVQVLAGFVDALDPLRWVSPMYLANGTTPIRNGWPLAQYAALGVVTAVLVLASRRVFERRDLGH
jgi:ABC-2 type transport system permease protein